MIKLTKVSPNYWLVIRKNKSYKIESIEKLFVYLLAFGIKFKEIETALLELEKNLHDYAEFGVYKKFVFSMKLDKREVYN